jgi:hypothetical protein
MLLKNLIMKHIIYFLMVVLLVSCKKDSVSYNNEFNKSANAWKAYKASVNNTYSYISYYGSVFGGYTETKITVQNGVVTGRDYIIGTYPPNSKTLQVMKSWTEDSATLNTHTEGAVAITLDAIYAKAPEQWLNADPKNNDISFTTDNNGLITSCGYSPKNCMDDCFNGVFIKSITRL